MRFWLSIFLSACVGCATAPTWAQPQAGSTAQTGAPRIDKIDPPNWWTDMPSPMLLVYGRGLKGARFTVSGTGVALSRAQASDNGHWAFLWLETQEAAAQTLEIAAQNAQGQTRRAYVLAARRHDARGHSGFSSADVMYLIMTDRFAHGASVSNPAGDNRAAPRGWHGGNFAGIEQHLNYLQQLGVTTVWLTPVVSNAGMPESYHGYAATDLYAVDPHFGTLAEYRQLSAALHARGMKLVIDLAPNHIGVAHPWVKDPPAPNWLHGTLAHHRALSSDFYQLVDMHAPPRDWLDITSGWFTNAMPDLNQENPLVARYLIQNALWWVETANLDGIRLDTFPYVDRGFWQEYEAALHSVYPHLTTVGEVFDRDPEVTSFFAGGVARRGADGTFDTGLDTLFDFPVYFALRDILVRGKPMTELARVLRQDELYPHPGRLVTFIGNHDTVRFLTAAGGSVAKLKLALGLIATLRGMPLIYYGDEIGMSGGPDPDNRRDFPGGFPGDTRSAFTPAGRTAQQEDIFRWTSKLLSYRAAHREMQTGMEQNLFADANGFAFVRAENGAGCAPDHSRERVLVVVNDAAQSKTLEIATGETALEGCTEFEAAPVGAAASVSSGAGKVRIVEPGESMSLYAVR